MERNLGQDIRVGIAVFVGLVMIAISVFVLGGSSDLFEERYRLNASFADISGLREGAVVRLAGIDVGEVGRIEFASDPEEKRVFVQVQLIERFRPRIRKDSVALISTEGVLGDKYITLTVGSMDEDMLEDDDWIETDEPLEFLSYMERAGEVLDNSAGIAKKVNLMLGEDQESAQASMASAVKTLDALLAQLESGDGLIHALMYDKDLADSVRNTLSNVEETTGSLRRSAEAVENGQGVAHALIYGNNGVRLTKQISSVAGALQTFVEDVKNEGSVAYALLYDEDNGQLVEDLQETATALRQVSEAMANAEGTLGLLANDPELYEDMRALLGGAQRNKLLKSYIRRTIEQAEVDEASALDPVPAE